MEDTTLDVIGILISAILLFFVPLFLVANRADEVSQLVAQTATSEFINEVIRDGKITSDSYQRLNTALVSSGITFDIDLEVKILDETTSKIVTDKDEEKIGNNSYYSIYTSQIEDKLGRDSEDSNNKQGKIILKQGDQVSVTVKNNSKTLSQTLKSIYYNVIGDDEHIIVATSAGTVAINGSTGTT